MMAAWNTAREVTFRPIERNLFMLQAYYLGDWKRITEEGPWLFCDCALMIEKYDGATANPPVPRCVLVWFQIHKIPPLFRTEAIIKQLAAKVGEVEKVEVKVASNGNGDFHRARVHLDAARPLMRFVTLSPEGRASMPLQVKYEKIPKFCKHCGLMGHGELECGSGEYSDEELQYGAWMLAPMETWHPKTPRVQAGFGSDREGTKGGRGQTDRGGRTMGHGRQGGGWGHQGGFFGHGETMWREKTMQQTNDGSRKRTSGEAGLEKSYDADLTDTATSPPKPVGDGNATDVARSSKVQRQLLLEGS
jgi:hypothetical protein